MPKQSKKSVVKAGAPHTEKNAANAAAQRETKKADPVMTVNGRSVAINPGDTILAACRRAGLHIPTLCNLEGFEASGSCRFCVVEVEGRPNLLPSCAYPAEPGMKIQTHSLRVLAARRSIIGLLLADHPGDCLACVRSGTCHLQELAAELNLRQRRSYIPRPHHELDISSPSITRETSKCVLCGKCVRVCEEIQGVSAIGFIGRGARFSLYRNMQIVWLSYALRNKDDIIDIYFVSDSAEIPEPGFFPFGSACFYSKPVYDVGEVDYGESAVRDNNGREGCAGGIGQGFFNAFRIRDDKLSLKSDSVVLLGQIGVFFGGQDNLA